jgi:2-polyprenyl-3-methyl-5-hydroxy-6-metoxy-1,4-benzoquinol methylase
MDIVLQNSTMTPVSTSNLSADQLFEQRACMLCQGLLDTMAINTFDTRFGIKGKYEVWRCSRCHFEQMYPVPTLAELKNLYELHYNFGGEQGTVYTTLREAFFSSVLYRVWVQLDGDLSFHARKGKGRLIDIGCNEGRGLDLYARNGFQVEGSELNETAAAQARGRAFTVHTQTLEDFRPAAPYDVAVLSNVLEHAVDPLRMLVQVRRILAPNGQIWISCPNNSSWLRKMFGKYWINWHLPFHISHFSTQTVTGLLEGAGFTGIRIRQITPASWVAMSIIARVFAKEDRPTRELRNPALLASLVLLVRFLTFPVLWLKNRRGQGDCLLITASRP